MESYQRDTDPSTPPDREEEAASLRNFLLPFKSKPLYVKVFDKYLAFCESTSRSPPSKAIHVSAYLNYLHAEGLAGSTIRQRFTIVRKGFHYHYNVSETDKCWSVPLSIANHMNNQHDPPEKVVFSSEHIVNFLKPEADGGFRDSGLNEKFMVALVMNSGVRLNELVGLRHSDFFLEGQDKIKVRFFISKSDRSNEPRKDRKIQIRLFSLDEFPQQPFLSPVYWYRLYCNELQRCNFSAEISSKSNVTIWKRYDIPYNSRQAVARFVNQPIGANKIAELGKTVAAHNHLEDVARYTFHVFRHTFATRLAESGRSQLIGPALNHKGNGTAQIYINNAALTSSTFGCFGLLGSASNAAASFSAASSSAASSSSSAALSTTASSFATSSSADPTFAAEISAASASAADSCGLLRKRKFLDDDGAVSQLEIEAYRIMEERFIAPLQSRLECLERLIQQQQQFQKQILAQPAPSFTNCSHFNIILNYAPLPSSLQPSKLTNEEE